MEREDDECEVGCGGADPAHAVDGGFVGEGDGSPWVAGGGGSGEEEDGSAFFGVGGFAGVPLGTDGDFGFAVAIDVAGGDADIVARGEVAGDDFFFPVRVVVPRDFLGVGDEDIVIVVAVDIADGEPVADGDGGVDGLGFEGGGGEGGDCGESDEGEEERARHGGRMPWGACG